jgi:hypothetical protein
MLRKGSAHNLLRQHGAPRWALYAARLYCQATLAANGGLRLAASFITLNREFAEVAEEYGRRWADVPYEALLTLGDPRAALEAVWPTLAGSQEPSLREVLAVARRRFTARQGVLPHAPVWIPVLAAVMEHVPDVDDNLHPILLEWIRELLLASALREYAGIGSVVQMFGRPLADRLEGYLLSRLGHRREAEKALEGLSLLASGMGTSTPEHLRSVAAEHPDELDKVVDGPIQAELLARHQPDLLLELSEAYFVRKRRRRAGRASVLSLDDEDEGFDDFEMGVRHHNRGVGFPFAGHDFGPFSALLKVRPAETIALIKRLVDHASQIRSKRLGRFQSGDRPTTSIDVGGGAREFVGDDHVYAWYRGLGVGPYPAMSALLALERHVDARLAAGEQLSDLASVVLDDAKSVAFVGLWVGVLVRNIKLVSDELDPFLSDPAVWHLEAARVTREHGDLRHHREEKVDQPEQRFWTFSQVAGYMTLTAGSARQPALADVRRRLRERAGTEKVVVENWARQLDPATYHVDQSGDQFVIRYQPPPDVEAGLAPSRRQREVAALIFRCMHVHSGYCQDESELDKAGVIRDMAAVRALSDSDIDGQGRYIFDAAGAVASASLLAAHRGEIQLDADERAWATETVLKLAEFLPTFDQGHWESSAEVFPMGFERSIARAIPLLFLDAEVATAAESALVRLAQSPYDEVGRSLANGLGIVWDAPCRQGGDQCGHRAAFRVVEEMVRCLTMGRWNDQGFRRRRRLEGELPSALEKLPARDLYMHSCIGAVRALDGCSKSSSCSAAAAVELERVLLAKFADAWVDWASRESYVDVSDAHSVHAVAAAHALDGDEGMLRTLVTAYRSHGALTASTLEGLAGSATTPARQSRLTELWPPLMKSAVDAIERGDLKDRNGQDELLRAVLPIQPGGVPVETWPSPPVIRAQVERIIALGLATPEFTSILATYLGQQALEVQISVGLPWMLSIVASGAGDLARRTRAPEWLESVRLRGAAQLKGDALSRWFQIVDLLAAHGDQRCVRLQLLEE